MEKTLYFLGLQPPEDLSAIITGLKEDIAVRYGSRHALKVPPHVTLVPPWRAAAEIRSLREALPGFAAGTSAVDLHLSGFGYFEQARTRVIYLAVTPTETLQNLHRKLRSLVAKTLVLPDMESDSDFHPHITLAHRDLTSAAFHLAWPGYRERVFEATCSVTAITLFAHDGQRWQADARYPFAGEA